MGFKPPPPAQSGHTIQDEGSDLTARAKLNFTGTGVSASDNPGTGATDVTINAGSAPDADASTKGLVQLAGDLAGTAASPQIAAGAIVNADVNAAAAIAESKLSLASDAAAGTASRRTLGTGATQAAAGNDARLSDTRTPTDGSVTAAKLAAALLDVDGTLAANSDTKVPSQKAVKTYVDAHASGSATTKRVTTAINGEGVNSFTYNPLDACVRMLVRLPVTTTQWRLRIRNYSSLSNAAGAGSLNFSGCWKGSPDVSDANSSTQKRWRGKFASAPTQVISSGTTPADASDYTTAWVTIAGHQFTAGALAALSVGIDSGGGSAAAFYDDRGLVFLGTGAAANAGAQGDPNGVSVNAGATLMDIRLEYEFSDTKGTPIVLCIGDSITSGWVSGTDTGALSTEAWPHVAALHNGFAAINAGVGSTRSDHWTAGTDWKWTRFDLATTVPDVAIISLGSNDVANSASAATIEGNLATIITKARALGIPRVLLGTVIPRNFGATPEAVRVALNNWKRYLPYSVEGVIDFDKALYVQATPATVDADFVNSYPHPTPGGYQKMATIVPRFA